MKKISLAAMLLLSILSKSHAQIEVDKFMGTKNGSHYGLGIGAFIKVAIPISEAASLTPEVGLVFAFLKDGGDQGQDGTAICPLKLGYRYTVNGSGTGFYVEPAIGYNIYGVTSYLDNNGYTQNEKFNGAILSAGVGYLFEPGGRV